MAHSIITVATMKGGSGKSTLASCLAVHWQLKGRRAAIIDADPQSTIVRLAAREKALGGVPVIEDATDDAFKTSIQEDVGIKPAWAAEAFPDLDEDVRQSIARIKASPFVPNKDAVRGFIYDVRSGALQEVT